MLHEPSAERVFDPFIVGEIFSLTPAEAKVAAAVARGLSLEQIAADARGDLDGALAAQVDLRQDRHHAASGVGGAVDQPAGFMMFSWRWARLPEIASCAFRDPLRNSKATPKNTHPLETFA